MFDKILVFCFLEEKGSRGGGILKIEMGEEIL